MTIFAVTEKGKTMDKYIKIEEVKAIITGYVQRNINFKKGFDLVHDTMAICETIDKMAAADVVEIVRCKDCKHCKEYERINGYYCNWHSTDCCTFATFLDDFCSYGERKTDNA